MHVGDVITDVKSVGQWSERPGKNGLMLMTRHFSVWTNQRGYGNIVVATIDNKNNVVGSVSPWNRIPALTYPTDTQVNPANACSNRPI